ncbi:MAG: hypothetical protein JWM33_1306 [Caulobacteraceae bacterium]|nr:hypothetical protein [Caulobacteraceae bacterium]
MKSSDVAFKFPVLAFTPDREIWGFPDMDRLTRCGPRTLKEDTQKGMELIDAKGQRWGSYPFAGPAEPDPYFPYFGYLGRRSPVSNKSSNPCRR